MKYILAKKLKDAGFAQTGAGYGIFEDGDIVNVSFIGHGNVSSVYCPTLSELIEACGDDFDRLELNTDSDTQEKYWFASVLSLDEGRTGSTPEEAVANLWLELNKK